MCAIMCLSGWRFVINSWVNTNYVNYTCPGVVLSICELLFRNSQFTKNKVISTIS